MMNNFIKTEHKIGKYHRINRVTGYRIGDAFSGKLHYDPCYTMVYFKKAKGEIRIDGRCYEISDGDVILLNCSEIHCADFDPSVYSDRITVYISKDIASLFSVDESSMFSAFYKKMNKIPRDNAKSYGIAALLEEMSEYADKSDDSSTVLAECKIAEAVLLLEKAQSPQRADIKNEAVRCALEFINSDCVSIRDCDTIAERAHISKYHLSRLFKEHVGVSMWDYVIFKRLLVFNDEVRKGVRLEDAAYNAGFTNYSNFYRLYKKHMNITPKEFKDTLV